jgi:hypothetical protein
MTTSTTAISATIQTTPWSPSYNLDIRPCASYSPLQRDRLFAGELRLGSRRVTGLEPFFGAAALGLIAVCCPSTL